MSVVAQGGHDLCSWGHCGACQISTHVDGTFQYFGHCEYCEPAATGGCKIPFELSIRTNTVDAILVIVHIVRIIFQYGTDVNAVSGIVGCRYIKVCDITRIYICHSGVNQTKVFDKHVIRFDFFYVTIHEICIISFEGPVRQQFSHRVRDIDQGSFVKPIAINLLAQYKVKHQTHQLVTQYQSRSN